ncbi:MAG TPA: hypothetical protein VFU21_31680 [Kofleriaceae bacterium]|nr:hypothetical protein [Kofleriaceae bacterium]
MENRNGRSRSAMESMRRRQLEARRLSESSPIAGLGTYQLMRPHRGREVLTPRKPVPRPPRLPNGSDAFGTIESKRDIADIAPPPPRSRPQGTERPRQDVRPAPAAQRISRAEVAPPPPVERPRAGWLVPMSLATAVSTLIIGLALWLR